MKVITSILILSLSSLTVENNELKADPLMGDFVEMANYHQFPVEKHEVTTEDGYILTIFRIPGRQGETVKEAIAHHYPPLLYIHGILDSSDGIVCDKVSAAPGYVYPNYKYDMWYYNYRGNTYSQKHTHLTPKDKAFWDFSFDTMAYYDIPAVLDYIIANTKHPKVNILGHSQGTMISWAFLTSHEDRVKGKIRSLAAWAPVAQMQHSTSLVTWFTKIPYIKQITDLLYIYNLFPRNYLESQVQRLLCKYVAVMCVDLIDIFADESDYYDKEKMPYFLGHAPNGISVKNALHVFMIYTQKVFGPYPTNGDQITPYNFQGIIKDIPVALFAGTNDNMADPTDVKWLKEQLSEAGVLNEYHEYGDGHLSFLIPKVTRDQHIFDTLAFYNKFNYPDE